MKTCSKCCTEKEIDAFAINKLGKHGRHSVCKACIRQKYVNNTETYNKDSKKYYQANKEKIQTQKKTYYTNNRAKVIAGVRKRETQMKHATMRWADTNYLNDLYNNVSEANAIFNSIGINVNFEVDHIVPLKHSKVCGLHCEDNLQVLSRAENRSKHNRFEIA